MIGNMFIMDVVKMARFVMSAIILWIQPSVQFVDKLIQQLNQF